MPGSMQAPMGYPSTSPMDTSSTNGYPSTTGYNAGPMLIPNRKDWKLGVFVQNTDAGAVITQVAPGSAGQQAGLETNDVIVAVGGSRIGSFDNRIVELADEIRRNTDPMGRVSILVFDSRQRTLQSIPVSMSSTSNAISGSVAIRDRIQLPYGSTLMVQIQNASNPYYEILGGKSVTRAEGFGPFTFELNIDARYIEPRDQYKLTAAIVSGNQELYRLPQPMVINPNALAQPMNIVLERSSPSFDNQNPSNGFPSSGNVINAGYPTTIDSVALTQLFQQYFGRTPSTREIMAWQGYLQQGNSINDLKTKLLSSPQFRDRFSNDSMYVQQLITATSGRAPNQQELAYWLGRLQATGSTEAVIGEMLSTKGR
jgi:uncharacterized lipoprotein YbaY